MNNYLSQEEITNLIKENKILNRRVERMAKEMKNIVALHDRALKLRDYSEREKNLQYEYNILLLENAPDMLFVMDPEMKLRLSTKSFLRFFGKGEDYSVLIGSSFDDLFVGSMPINWIESTRILFESAMNERRQVEYNDNVVINGDRKVFSISIAPAIDSNGKVMGVICLMHDSTELFKMKEVAEAATLAKSSFLASMSHEIRTPMNAIKGFSDLMAMTPLSSQQKTYVDNILSATSSLLVIINDILDFSKIEANRYKIINTEYDTITELTKLCGLMQPKADEKGIYFVADIDPDLPAAMLGDAQRIQQILLNIINNALKFTNEGGILLSVQGEPLSGDNWLITYSVKDTGQGIKAEELPVIFQAFEQADYYKNKNISGTGLGLAISKNLAALMNGDITAISEYGIGSEFIVKIPQTAATINKLACIKNLNNKNVLIFCTDAVLTDHIGLSLKKLYVNYKIETDTDILYEAAQIDKFSHIIIDNSEYIKNVASLCPRINIACIRSISDPELNMLDNTCILFKPVLIVDLANFINGIDNNISKKPADNNKKDSAGFEGARVLIVDDNEINLIVASEMINSFNIVSETADSGIEAINMLKDDEYDIVFMDHMMPGMDGIEATLAIRAMDIRQPVIISLTANAITGMEEVYKNAGFDGYITKPIDMDNLYNVLKTWLPNPLT